MKTLFFYTDTETTGLLKERDQILTYAKVLVLGEEILVEEEIKVLLKDNVFPNPKALLVNNVNPFSEDFKKKALSEYDAAHHLANFLFDKKKEGFRIVLIAYNSDYDEKMYRDMFHRTGIVFESLVDIIYDPLTTSSALVDSGMIKTKEVQTGYGKSYRSKKLEDVYNALGFSSSGLTTHNSLEDTKILKTLTSKVYFLTYGKHIEEASIDVSDWIVGDSKTILFNVENRLEQKTIKILKKDESFFIKQFLVLDYDLFKTSEDTKKSIYWLDSHKIFDQLDPVKEQILINDIYSKNQTLIDLYVEKQNPPEIKVFNSFEEAYFGKIEKISELKLTNQVVENPICEELIRAEEYSYSRYNKGWSRKELGDNFENEEIKLEISSQVSISKDPIGSFKLYEEGKTILESLKKTEILEYLVKNKIVEDKSELYKKASNFMVAIKNFSNPKHPSLLEEEFNENKTFVFNGANQNHKEMMKGLLNHYQKNNSKAFKNINLPDFKINLGLFKKK